MAESAALGANVGSAWVALRFSARGAGTQIRRELAGETAGLGATLGDNTGKKFRSSFGRHMSGMGGQIKSALAPLKVYAPAALAIIGVESAKMATTFQSSMLKVRTQAGASQREVNNMSKAILAMATASQQTPQHMAEATYHLESLGLRGAKAIAALKTSIDLANVSGADLEQTTNAIGGAWRTGIKGAQNFTKAAATLNAVVGAGNMRMSDLLGALGTGILPAAKTFGLNLSQVGSALALFTDEGVPATDAATRLRMSFSLLGAPSGQAVKQLAKIGLSGESLATAMRGPNGLIGAISLLKEKLDKSGMSAVQQAALLSRAFGGGRSSSAILSMLNNLDVLKRKQEQVNKSLGKYGPAVQAQRKTAQAQFSILRSSIDDMMIRLGGVLLPPAVSFVKFINNTAIPAAGRLVHAFKSIIPVDSIKRDWHALQHALGGGKTQAPTFVRQDHKLVSSAAATGGGMQLGSSLGMALGKSLGSLTANFGKLIMKAFSGIDWFSVGKAVGGNAIGFALGFIENIGADLFTVKFWKKHWLDTIIGVLSLIGVGKIAGPLEKILTHIPIARMFIPLLRKLGKVADPLFNAGWKVIKALGRGILDGIEKTLPHEAGVLAKWLELMPTRFGVAWFDMMKFGESLIRGLGKGILSVAGRLGSIIGRIIGLVLRPWVKSGTWLVKHGMNIIGGLLHGISGYWGRVARWLGGVAGRVTGPFRSAGRWLFTHGRNVIAGLLRGIQTAMAGIGSWIKRVVVDPIINWVKHHFGIHSPSVVMHGIGGHLISGLLRGIVTSNPVGAISKIFGSLPNALGALVHKGLINISKLPGKALNALGKASGAVGGWFKGIGGWFSKLIGGGGGGVSRWKGTVLKALAMNGLPASLVGRVLYQMQTESGGNPNAVNNWDINAKNGDPSRGLMQVIGSTFSSYHVPGTSRNILDPLANIAAAINYARHAYGPSLGALGSGHGYDSGGVAHGLGYLPKYTPKPERVLSPKQTSAFERLVDHLDGSGKSSGPLRVASGKVDFDPRTMEMWIRDLAIQEAGAEINFRK